MIASLEGLRGAAALLVVLFHAVPVPFLPAIGNGYLAVDLFFVLSGFVICRTYASRLASPAAVRTFVIRRIGRLWPVHVVTISVSIACVYTVAHTIPSVPQAVAFATMAQGLVFGDSLVTGVSWSASDELYVYLVFAAVCMLARGRSRVVAFAALALLGYVVAVWAALGPNSCLTRGSCFSMHDGYGISRCLAGFFIGALVVEFRDTRAVRALSRRVPQAITAGVALVFANVAGVHGIALAAPAIFAALVASLASDCGAVARFLQRPMFQYLGRVSYSLYLGHGAISLAYVSLLIATRSSPIATLVIVFGYLAVCALLTHLLSRYVETPWRARFAAWSDAHCEPNGSSVAAKN